MLPEKLIFETSCKQGAVRAVRFNCKTFYIFTIFLDRLYLNKVYDNLVWLIA